jgi:hypothetical protein
VSTCDGSDGCEPAVPEAELLKDDAINVLKVEAGGPPKSRGTGKEID